FPSGTARSATLTSVFTFARSMGTGLKVLSMQPASSPCMTSAGTGWGETHNTTRPVAFSQMAPVEGSSYERPSAKGYQMSSVQELPMFGSAALPRFQDAKRCLILCPECGKD